MQEALRAAKSSPEADASAAQEQEQPAAQPETGEEPSQSVELTPEQRQALLEYLLPEVLDSEPVKAQVLTEAAKAAEVDARLWQLAQQGQQAAQTVINQVIAARKMLEEAEQGGMIDLKNAPDPQVVGQAILQVGAAMSARTLLDVADAIGVAQQYVLSDLPLEEKDIADATRMVNRFVAEAQQMRNDPNNAEVANAYMFSGVLKTVAELARQAGRKEMQQEYERKQAAAKKVLDSNALAAAQALLAKGNLPKETPSSIPAPSPAGTTAESLMEQYREAKRSGNFEEADRIALLIARRARGAGR